MRKPSEISAASTEQVSVKPYVICHMATSLDGRILPGRWSPGHAHVHDTYDRLHYAAGGGTWLVGRITGQEFAKASAYPTETDQLYERSCWLPFAGAEAYGVVLDRHGKIAWGRSDVDGDPIVVVLGRDVADAHLAGLRADGVGYIFGGDTDFTLSEALGAIGRELNVDRLMLEGGGDINGGFLREHLIDELSLILTPAVDGRRGAPALFDGPPDVVVAAIQQMRLVSHEVVGDGELWLRYHIDYK